jgi:choline dehydrogenase-like flavoprotein
MNLVDQGRLPDRAETLIVGGGLAGLQLAKELDRRGATGVLVLEAGPADDLTHINTAHDADTALRMWVEPYTDPYFWRPWKTVSEPHYGGAAGLRKRMGGRSLYWHGVTLPLESWALCQPWWPASIVRDLTESWRGGPSLYELVADELRVWREADGPSAEPAAPLRVGGYRLVETPQAARGIAAGGDKPWCAYSPAYHWADGAADTVAVAVGAEVVGVTVANGAVSGVQVNRGGEQHIAADRVVLAAGTIENTRLAVQTWDNAGCLLPDPIAGLVDHITQGFVAVLDAASLPERIVALADRDSFFYCPASPLARSNLFVRLYRNLAGGVVLDAWAMGEQTPSAETIVEYTATASWPWEVAIRAGLADEDRQLVSAQRDELDTFWQAWCDDIGTEHGAGLTFPAFETPERTLEEVMPGIAEAAPDDTPITWCGPLGSEYHEAGTLPLGSAVDENHQLVGVPGLYVAGPATFPRIGAANPSMTSFALAKRLAGVLQP